MLSKCLAIGIIFLFIISSAMPFVIGINSGITKENKYLEKLAFVLASPTNLPS